MDVSVDVLSEQQLEVLDGLPATAAIVDADGMIRAVNRAWRDFATANGRTDVHSDIGWSYRQWIASSDPDAATAAAGVFDVITGEVSEFSFAYPCHAPFEKRWFELLVVPLRIDVPRPVLAAHMRAGERVAAALAGMTREALRRLEGIVTLCAWCQGRRIGVTGEWTAVDGPLPGPDEISHGICPECIAALALD